VLWPDTTQRSPDGSLSIGGVELCELASQFGTPLYVFDEATLRNRVRAVTLAASRNYDRVHLVYAAKAFLNSTIVNLLLEEGMGIDVVSGGELFAALASGAPPGEITFHGNNKSRQELEEAIEAGVGLIAVDNADEMELLAQLSSSAEMPVRILLRLNPGIDVHTHGKIATGVVDSKFGFPLWTGDAAAGVERAVSIRTIQLAGYHTHLGSQLFDLEAPAIAVRKILEFAAAMRDRHGFTPEIVSPGGGLGIAYREDDVEIDPDSWLQSTAEATRDACNTFQLPLPELVFEPGRWIVGPAAVALYRVGTRKRIEGVRTYVSVDGGMADNIRPSLYDAQYTAELANRAGGERREVVTIAGKYCESGDVLIRDIDLPMLETDDLLAIPAAGAYCLSMASNYNLALRPAVVLIREGKATLIRRRETYSDLLQFDGSQIAAVGL
jgi:diaminopimelate decarboxylase